MHGDFVAIHIDIECFIGLRFVGGTGGQGELLAGEHHADRGVALGD